MKSIVRDIFDAIFSGMTLFIAACVVFGYLLMAVASKSNEQTRACVEADMVKVTYSSSSYCVAVTNLVEIKQ